MFLDYYCNEISLIRFTYLEIDSKFEEKIFFEIF